MKKNRMIMKILKKGGGGGGSREKGGGGNEIHAPCACGLGLLLFLLKNLYKTRQIK